MLNHPIVENFLSYRVDRVEKSCSDKKNVQGLKYKMEKIFLSPQKILFFSKLYNLSKIPKNC